MDSEADFTAAAGLTDDSCPAPLDCSDLAKTLRTDKAAAVRLLMNLTPIQLNLQALAYAAYLNQLQELDLDMEDVLADWHPSMEHARLTT